MTTATHKPNADAPLRKLIEKIVVNAGLGRASQQQNFEEKVLKQVLADLALITGQQPHVTRAKKSIAGFKTREGQVIGARATLRGKQAVDFWKRLTTIVLPRVRDFRGVDPHNIDRAGALNLGFREQFVFPEVNPEESTFTFSLGVNVVPKTRRRAEALEAYRANGIPFAKEGTERRIKGK